MVESCSSLTALSPSIPTVPRRGGPTRRSTMALPVSEDGHDSADSENDTFTGRTPDPNPSSSYTSTGPHKVFGMANPDRPYNMWLDDQGSVVPAYGALIPDDYKHDTTLPDRPWVCPVRNCRRLFLVLSDMGLHFKGRHRGCLLNDNLDGTFSIVGNDTSTASITVVSRDPMDLEPVGDPQRPSYPGRPGTRNVRWVKAVAGEVSPDAVQIGLSPPPIPSPIRHLVASPGAATRSSRSITPAAGHLWSYICSHIDGKLPNIEGPEFQLLLGLPRARDLAITHELPVDLNDKQIAGLIIQVTGTQNLPACSECRHHNGPCTTCVTAPGEVSVKTTRLMGMSGLCCANCIIRKSIGRCSLRRPYKLAQLAALKLESQMSYAELSRETAAEHERAGVLELGDTPDLADVDTPGAARIAQATSEDRPRRRVSGRVSGRLSQENALDGWDGEDEGSPVEATPQPKRKLITFKIKNGRLPQERPAADRTGSPPPEAYLHMEDWELDGRRITTAGDTLALTTTHLTTTAQTVHLSPAITVAATAIRSGSTHQFPADNTRTRVCTLASGKLRVQVDGEDEFVIGANGVFRIARGVRCSVVNRCYVDVVLQVMGMGEK
ncbi:hypothetical protein BT67DRAFT_291727 [Trichocladium antarcticum]|uniref:C2H2-type domain-containing protein n=1 Tax=Trichocladium antarcticum TaxID=1450529 RepID=A0AAN6ZE89_9PEZI|nr:hypothetical protein BT67DRAFT_291727 [Trichocladium antarcticum]